MSTELCLGGLLLAIVLVGVFLGLLARSLYLELELYTRAWERVQTFRERADKLTDGKGYVGYHWVEALVLEAERLSAELSARG